MHIKECVHILAPIKMNTGITVEERASFNGQGFNKRNTGSTEYVCAQHVVNHNVSGIFFMAFALEGNFPLVLGREGFLLRLLLSSEEILSSTREKRVHHHHPGAFMTALSLDYALFIEELNILNVKAHLSAHSFSDIQRKILNIGTILLCVYSQPNRSHLP